MDYIRTWTEIDVKDLEAHILIVDDKFGYCPACKEIGIKLEGIKACPKCQREIKYVTARELKGGGGIDMVGRIRRKLPQFVIVDYDNYEKLTSQHKAKGLFKDI